MTREVSVRFDVTLIDLDKKQKPRMNIRGFCF